VVRHWLTPHASLRRSNIKKDTSPDQIWACLFFGRLSVGSCIFVMLRAKLPEWAILDYGSRLIPTRNHAVNTPKVQKW
jgi:hypothetical protein